MALRPATAPRASQLTRRRVAIAAALCVSLSPAWAQFSSSGLNNVFPGNAAVPGGAGFADLGNVGLCNRQRGSRQLFCDGGQHVARWIIRHRKWRSRRWIRISSCRCYRYESLADRRWLLPRSRQPAVRRKPDGPGPGAVQQCCFQRPSRQLHHYKFHIQRGHRSKLHGCGSARARGVGHDAGRPDGAGWTCPSPRNGYGRLIEFSPYRGAGRMQGRGCF